MKQFPFAGGRMADFRVDMWNLTNTPAFGNPNGSFGAATFGEINSLAKDQRVMRFAVRFMF